MIARSILTFALSAFFATAAAAQEDVVSCQPDQLDSTTGAFPCGFNVAMSETTSNTIVQANFELPALGTYYEISMDFYRNGAKVFDMSTYAVTWLREGDHVRLKISTWDRKNRRGKFDHRVEGILMLKPDPNPIQ